MARSFAQIVILGYVEEGSKGGTFMAKRYRATKTNIEQYWALFVNRRAYVLQSKRPHAKAAAITISGRKPAKTARRSVWPPKRSGGPWKVI